MQRSSSGKKQEKLEKIPAWQLTKVRIKKEVIAEAKNGGKAVHFESLMDINQWKDSVGKQRNKIKEGGVRSGPGEGLRACQPSCGLGLGDTLQFSKKDLTRALRLFWASEKGAIRRMCGRAIANHHGHFARIQVELFANAHCVARCTEWGHEILILCQSWGFL